MDLYGSRIICEQVNASLRALQPYLKEYAESPSAEGMNLIFRDLDQIAGALGFAGLDQFYNCVVSASAVARYLSSHEQNKMDSAPLLVLTQAVIQLPMYIERLMEHNENNDVALYVLQSELMATIESLSVIDRSLLSLPDTPFDVQENEQKKEVARSNSDLGQNLAKIKHFIARVMAKMSSGQQLQRSDFQKIEKCLKYIQNITSQSGQELFWKLSEFPFLALTEKPLHEYPKWLLLARMIAKELNLAATTGGDSLFTDAQEELSWHILFQCLAGNEVPQEQYLPYVGEGTCRWHNAENKPLIDRNTQAAFVRVLKEQIDEAGIEINQIVFSGSAQYEQVQSIAASLSNVLLTAASYNISLPELEPVCTMLTEVSGDEAFEALKKTACPLVECSAFLETLITENESAVKGKHRLDPSVYPLLIETSKHLVDIQAAFTDYVINDYDPLYLSDIPKELHKIENVLKLAGMDDFSALSVQTVNTTELLQSETHPEKKKLYIEYIAELVTAMTYGVELIEMGESIQPTLEFAEGTQQRLAVLQQATTALASGFVPEGFVTEAWQELDKINLILAKGSRLSLIDLDELRWSFLTLSSASDKAGIESIQEIAEAGKDAAQTDSGSEADTIKSIAADLEKQLIVIEEALAYDNADGEPENNKAVEGSENDTTSDVESDDIDESLIQSFKNEALSSIEPFIHEQIHSVEKDQLLQMLHTLTGISRLVEFEPLKELTACIGDYVRNNVVSAIGMTDIQAHKVQTGLSLVEQSVRAFPDITEDQVLAINDFCLNEKELQEEADLSHQLLQIIDYISDAGAELEKLLTAGRIRELPEQINIPYLNIELIELAELLNRTGQHELSLLAANAGFIAAEMWQSEKVASVVSISIDFLCRSVHQIAESAAVDAEKIKEVGEQVAEVISQQEAPDLEEISFDSFSSPLSGVESVVESAVESAVDSEQQPTENTVLFDDNELDDLADVESSQESERMLASDLIALVNSQHNEGLSAETDDPSFIPDAILPDALIPDAIDLPADETAPDSHIDPEMLGIFVSEAEDILEEAGFVINGLTLPVSAVTLENLQRLLHTLKGGARMSGLEKLGEVTHALEDYYERCADGRRALTETDLELLKTVQTELSVTLSTVAVQCQDITSPALPGLVESLGTQRPDAEKIIHDVDTEAGITETDITETDDAKSDDALSEFRELVTGSDIFPDEIPVLIETVQSETDTGTGDSEQTVEPVQQLVSKKANSKKANSKKAEEKPPVTIKQTIKVETELLSSLAEQLSETTLNGSSLSRDIARLDTLYREFEHATGTLTGHLRFLETEMLSQIAASRYAEESQAFDPLEMDRYSSIHETTVSMNEAIGDLSELSEQMLSFLQSAKDNLSNIQNTTAVAGETIREINLVPLNEFAPGLKRTVQKTAMELGKDIRFSIENGSAPVERSLMDSIKPALSHLIRNAIDHGIETSTEERRSAGKPEQGTLTISLKRAGEQLTLSVSDDGRGIDTEAVRNSALQKGLIQNSSTLSESEIYNLILQPGFSTAETLTKISGRGVGLNVVSEQLKTLGGTLSITSEKGAGTTFSITVPFVSTSISAVIASVSGVNFCIPSNLTYGIMQLPAQEISRSVSESGELIVEGETFRICDLGHLLFGKASVRQSAMMTVIMVQAGADKAILVADETLGREDIQVTRMPELIRDTKGITGSAILRNGLISYVLDTSELTREQTVLIPDTSVDNNKEPLRVIVVDDSITVRKYSSKRLSEAGYIVDSARDGMDALEKIPDFQPDVLLLDVEMPRMNGFELARHLRKDPKWEGIGIIMITSRTGQKHRDAAEDIGVQGYLGKPYRDQELFDILGKIKPDQELSCA